MRTVRGKIFNDHTKAEIDIYLRFVGFEIGNGYSDRFGTYQSVKICRWCNSNDIKFESWVDDDEEELATGLVKSHRLKPKQNEGNHSQECGGPMIQLDDAWRRIDHTADRPRDISEMVEDWVLERLGKSRKAFQSLISRLRGELKKSRRQLDPDGNQIDDWRSLINERKVNNIEEWNQRIHDLGFSSDDCFIFYYDYSPTGHTLDIGFMNRSA
jgi:hypothetical protein